MTELHTLINSYINDPASAENNFALGQYYYNIGQTASAVSYFIRTAERTTDDLLKYECLILAAKCLEQQGTRAFSVQGMLMHAVSLLPKRPEAYYLMSKFYEWEKVDGNWFRCYMMTSIALNVCDFNVPPLRNNFGFPGKYGMLFQKALSSWWCGLCEDSKALFQDLLENYPLDENHKRVTINNIQYMNGL
jgi:tetratricopeptide (TPR) repeat protein